MPAELDTVELLRQAIDHHQAGRAEQAEALYRRLIARQPDHPEASHNLGVLLAARGETVAALALLKAALEQDRSQERYWVSYVHTLEQAGRTAEAAEVLAQGRARGLQGFRVDILHARLEARQLEPQALADKIARLHQERRFQEMLESARLFTERFPNEAYGWKALGAALRDLGQPRQAAPFQQRAIELAPRDATAYLNLANTYNDLGLPRESVPLFEKAIELGADLPLVHLNLSVVLKTLHRLVEAEAHCRRAIALEPDFGGAHQHLASVLAHLSDYREVKAESDLGLARTAEAQTPDAGLLYQLSYHTRLYVLSYHPDLPVETIFQEFLRWGDGYPVPAADFSGHDRTPGRRLRIGYVSPDFREHTSRFYFMPLMANHDHRAFETYAYSNVAIEDEHTAAFKQVFDHWRPIRGLTADQAAALVRRDQIDILVDCCNHMLDDRLDVFALKPAPIQVTWLGAAWTTGLRTVDYVMYDPHLAPEGTLAREEIVRLPGSFLCYRPPATTAAAVSLPAGRKGHVTFGYTGRTERLNHRTFRVWGEILRRVPGSRLILDYPPFADPPTQAHYRRLVAEHGLDPSRVEMRRSPNVFEGLGDIDILLDSFPHSGGTILIEALWMGVPVLTLKSRPPLGRIGTSFVSVIGLSDWAAETEADYIEKAVAFAADLPALAALRAGLRERMQASPLMDEPAFAKGFEDAYRAMWARWIGASPPSPLWPSDNELTPVAALYAEGRFAEVETLARGLTQSWPSHPFGWKALGAVLRDLGRGEQALAALQRAVELAPNDPEALNNLANVLGDLGRWGEAADHYLRAIALGTQEGAIYFNAALALRKVHRLAEAAACARQAVALMPDYALARQQLSIALTYLSEFEEATVQSDLAVAADPGPAELWEMRLYGLSYHPDLPAEDIYREFVRWGDRFPDPVVDFSGHDRTPGRRLRIGYVSPDFRKHTSRFYFMPLMANHDHAAFETFAYSNVLRPDPYTEAFRAEFDHWRDIRELTAEEAARLIRQDEIDILVDCCNHMLDDRLDVFALKPAPIQATWLGAAWTTGLKSVDYVLFDPNLAPEGTLAREEIVRLPNFFVAYRAPDGIGGVAPPPALRNGYLTFGYTGRTERLNHHVFRVWGEILRRVPGSRLILDFHPFDDPPTQAHYRTLMARHGLDPSRVEMRRSPDIFDGLNDIDILLDSFPHSGGTMLVDALWMGVPALTLKSRPPVGRIATSLLTTLGMPEWAADTEAHYIDKAVAFAADLPALAAVRAGLRDRMKASPFMDEQRFARDVEAAYRTMWARWSSQAPQPRGAKP